MEGTEEGFSYAFNYLADKMAQDPNARFSLQELLESIGSGAVSGLAFGTGGTLVNRSGALPHVIEQTGTAKQAPTKTSLHLADGQVQGLPMVVDQLKVTQKAEPTSLPMEDKSVKTVQNLPLKEQESGQVVTEPQPLPGVENEKTAGQSQTEDIQWDMIPYEDVDQQTQRMQTKHAEMVKSGNVVEIPESEINRIAEYYPDLRSMKKNDRNVVLKEKMKALKSELTAFLKSLTKEKLDFTVKDNVIEARVYDAGVREVRKTLTQEKVSMLSGSREIFKNAQYLYSTPDYENNPHVYRWNYFYTPVKLGDQVVGVRIAVRDMRSDDTHQIYNWNIKNQPWPAGVWSRTNFHPVVHQLISIPMYSKPSPLSSRTLSSLRGCRSPPSRGRELKFFEHFLPTVQLCRPPRGGES